MKLRPQSLSSRLVLALAFLALATEPRPASASSPLVGLLITTQTGCVEWKKSGDCPKVDFVPSGLPGDGSGNFNDEDIQDIYELCSPAAIGLDWMSTSDPKIPAECEEIILDGLDLSDELASPSTSDERATRSALARALHVLLFVPLVQTGGFFGSAEPEDYCPAIYEDFLGASYAGPSSRYSLSDYTYRNGIARTGKLLVQFILERTTEFAYKAAYDYEESDGLTTIASEWDGRIYLGPAFAAEKNPLILASNLVHESRHNSVGFQDGSVHIKCSGGAADGKAGACDRTNFGSYGTGAAYLDAAIQGGIRSTTEDGSPLLTLGVLIGAYREGCSKYLNRIERRSDTLTDFFESTTCTPDYLTLLENIASMSGMKAEDVLYR